MILYFSTVYYYARIGMAMQSSGERDESTTYYVRYYFVAKVCHPQRLISIHIGLSQFKKIYK